MYSFISTRSEPLVFEYLGYKYFYIISILCISKNIIYLFSARSLIWLSIEKLSDEILRLWWKTMSQWILGFLNLFVKICVGHAFKGEPALKHCEQENSECPNVGFLSDILCFRYDFRRHVWWSATEYFELLVFSYDDAKPKVNYFNIISRVYQNIFQFNISVHYVQVMTVLQSLCNLTK